MLQNLAERLNDENFNTYENDDNRLYTVRSPHKNNNEAWYALANETRVTEAFMRNHFYVLLTPRKRPSITPPSQTLPVQPPVNLGDSNTFIDLSDVNQQLFDVRDDQEIHIRPIEIFLPVDVMFAGEQGMFRLYRGNRVCPSAGDGHSMGIKTQRIDHRCALFLKFHAINRQPGALMPLCEGLALTNWYDYDLCLGRINDVPGAAKPGWGILPIENVPHSGWYCGVRAPLVQAVKKRSAEWREWTWMDSELTKVTHFGQIDFFYWNILFLRKRFTLYENPLNAVRLNTKQFIEHYSWHKIQGNMLDLCFDCWNFTNNLGEIVSILSYSDITWDKKKMQNTIHDGYSVQWV